MRHELEEIAEEGVLVKTMEKIKEGVMKCLYIDKIIAVYRLSRLFDNLYFREKVR